MATPIHEVLVNAEATQRRRASHRVAAVFTTVAELAACEIPDSLDPLDPYEIRCITPGCDPLADSLRMLAMDGIPRLDGAELRFLLADDRFDHGYDEDITRFLTDLLGERPVPVRLGRSDQFGWVWVQRPGVYNDDAANRLAATMVMDAYRLAVSGEGDWFEGIEQIARFFAPESGH